MATGQLHTIVRHLRRLAGQRASAPTDRQLLERFAAARDEDAFDELVRRHGPMVLNVCRRVLQCEHDAEDAFQATFLVLARKTASLRWQESIGNWLYEVAYRLASKAKVQAARRSMRERQAPRSDAVPMTDLTLGELQQVLDADLARLPEKYRAPLVLCYLEGMTRDEAAAQLGWSPGEVKGRLERGREALRARLTRRGLALPGALFALLFAQEVSSAAVPAALAAATVRAGVALTAGQSLVGLVSPHILTLSEEVVHAMFVTKLKVVAAVVLTVVIAGAGIGLVGTGSGPGQVFAQDEKKEKAAPKRDEPVQKKDGDREAPTVRGILKGVDAKLGTVTLRAGEGEAKDRTFNLSRNVQVLLDRKPAKVAELTAGTMVWLELRADGDEVVAIRTGLADGGRERDGDVRKGAPRQFGPTMICVVPVTKMPEPALLTDLNRQYGERLQAFVSKENNAVILRGDRPVIQQGLAALRDAIDTKRFSTPREDEGGRGIDLVRLNHAELDQVVSLVKKLVPGKLEISPRPAARALIFEGEPDAVRQAADLARQLDGQPNFLLRRMLQGGDREE